MLKNRFYRRGIKKLIFILNWVVTFITLSIKLTFKHGNIILINTPTHGNIGDQAIALAEIEFIRRIQRIETLVVISEDEWMIHKRFVKSRVPQKSIVLIHGGGYIGTLWRNEALTAFDIMKEFSKNPKILMPQTVYYNDLLVLEKDRDVFSNIKYLTVFARDKQSYNIFVNQLCISSNNVFLVPDIVASYSMGRNYKQRNNKALVVLRSDKEKVTNDSFYDKVIALFNKYDIETIKIDMFDDVFLYSFRKLHVYRKLKQFSKAKLVITDRLHGMYFSAITGTPCYALDNISKKVSGGHYWLKEYESILVFYDEESLLKHLDNNLSVGIKPYTYYPNDELFAELRNEIIDKLGEVE